MDVRAAGRIGISVRVARAMRHTSCPAPAAGGLSEGPSRTAEELNMPQRPVWISAIVVACLLGGLGGLRAGDAPDAPNKPGERRPPPVQIAKFILAHAQELSLTDDQKQKFEAILKEHQGERPPRPGGEDAGKPGEGPFAGVLTQEQREKMRELMKAEHGDRRPPLGQILKFMLAHAQELNLTDEQKQKLEAILKEHQGEHPRPEVPKGERPQRPGGEGPFAELLTPEQREKLRELLKAELPARPHGDRPPPGDEGKP
jgi:Spy/CpxP family protein refolding chaperone